MPKRARRGCSVLWSWSYSVVGGNQTLVLCKSWNLLSLSHLSSPGISFLFFFLFQWTVRETPWYSCWVKPPSNRSAIKYLYMSFLDFSCYKITLLHCSPGKRKQLVLGQCLKAAVNTFCPSCFLFSVLETHEAFPLSRDLLHSQHVFYSRFSSLKISHTLFLEADLIILLHHF